MLPLGKLWGSRGPSHDMHSAFIGILNPERTNHRRFGTFPATKVASSQRFARGGQLISFLRFGPRVRSLAPLERGVTSLASPESGVHARVNPRPAGSIVRRSSSCHEGGTLRFMSRRSSRVGLFSHRAGPLTALSSLAALVSFASLSSCASSSSNLSAQALELSHLRGAGVGSFEDPTVRGGRLVPERVDLSVLTGTEPDGAKRGILAGYRVLAMPDGAILVSDDRLAQTPQSALAVPSRLGGGYLHVVGSSILRSDTWLSEVKPVYVTQSPIQRIFVGLDRVYVRTQTGHAALDPRSGEAKPLGPFPPGPQIVAYAARDGWRAAAVADLLGLVTTEDAGATWRKLDLGIDARTVTVTDAGRLVVSGTDASRSMVSFEVREGGQAVRLGGAGKPTFTKPSTTKKEGSGEPDADAPSKPAEARAFGTRPLTAAIEDGWPLTDGVALVARDGALGRVRLEDGALLEAIPRAFPLSPARCHGISLHRPNAKGAFGFVCGEPRGRTDLYAYDPMGGSLVLLRRFDKPRVVLSSGQGALAVRGSCAAEDVVEATNQRTYCVLDYDNRFREVRVKGDVGSERLAVLADRRIAILSPPAGEVTTARLTLLDPKGAAKTVPLTFPRVSADVARALRYGVWLEGLEERRPGVLGAWVDAGGSVLGMEIATDGTVVVGQYVREAGLPTVQGRYGFGMTNARRLYETVDGGMTWQSQEAPEPLVPLAKVMTRAVGPVGALAAGWLRVGWGEREKKKAEANARAPEPVRTPSHVAPQLMLSCEPIAKSAKSPPSEREPTPKTVPKLVVGGPTIKPSYPGGPFGGFGGVYGGSRFPNELSPFYASAPPKLRDGEHPMLNVDAYDAFDRAVRGAPLAKIYGWGPKGPDPDPASRFMVRWLWPYDGYDGVRSTAPSSLPPSIVDGMRVGVGGGMYGSYYPGTYTSSWMIGLGDDGAHALLGARVSGKQGVSLWELEADRGPLAVRRADGEDLQEIETAVRVQGKWVIATPEAGGNGTLLFAIDGGTARLLARLPRANPLEGSRAPGKLARRSDGRAVGYVVDSSGPGSRGQAERWVLPVDLETGVPGDPMSLGAPDYFDRPLGICSGDEPGFVIDLPFSPNSLRMRGAHSTMTFSNTLARMRLSSTHVCLEAAAGTLSVSSDDKALVATKPPSQRPTLHVTAFAAGMRYPLSCTSAP